MPILHTWLMLQGELATPHSFLAPVLYIAEVLRTVTVFEYPNIDTVVKELVDINHNEPYIWLREWYFALSRDAFPKRLPKNGFYFVDAAGTKIEDETKMVPDVVYVVDASLTPFSVLAADMGAWLHSERRP
jgi:hypothetical protein